MELSYFTSFQLGWLNAWIPSFALVAVQFLFMMVFREGGKRAVDTSWYTAKDKRNGLLSSLFQVGLLVVSFFVPFKMGTGWFTVGAVLYLLAFVAFIWSFVSYSQAPADKTITGGIYRYSRNPMYFAFNLGMAGVCIASASLWLLLGLIPFIITIHWTILGEECYCEQTYGDEYLEYKAKTPRYFLFF